MKFEYYEKFDFEPDVVYYILGYMTFLCTFIIGIKLMSISIFTSLVLFSILIITSTIYLFNIKKYSLFKYDIILFLGIYMFFSIIYLISGLQFIYCLNQRYKYLLIFIILICLINYIISILKLSKYSILDNYRVLFIISYFIYVCISMILLYSYFYAVYNNCAIQSYINNNCKFVNSQKYKIIDINKNINNYLFIEPKNKYHNLLISSNNEFEINELNEFIKLTFNPIYKVEDYIIFSAQNYFNGKITNINIYGSSIRLMVISEKFIFAIIMIVTITSLIDVYKLKEDIKKESYY